jgi:hypothetical protein
VSATEFLIIIGLKFMPYLDCATFPVKFLGYSIYVLLSPVNAVWTERELKSRHQ